MKIYKEEPPKGNWLLGLDKVSTFKIFFFILLYTKSQGKTKQQEVQTCQSPRRQHILDWEYN